MLAKHVIASLKCLKGTFRKPEHFLSQQGGGIAEGCCGGHTERPVDGGEKEKQRPSVGRGEGEVSNG